MLSHAASILRKNCPFNKIVGCKVDAAKQAKLTDLF